MSRREAKKRHKKILKLFEDWVYKHIEADMVFDKQLRKLMNMPDFFETPLTPQNCYYEWDINKSYKYD